MNDEATLLPCPFCGSEAEMFSDGRRTWGLVQHNDGCLFPSFTKHEIPESDFASWNTRAPIEYDDWFYLPKPKESIVQHGAQRIEKTETGYRAEQPIEVIESAIRSWGDKLDEHIMKRICEVWYISEELDSETCEMVTSGTACKGNTDKRCTACGAYGIGEHYDGDEHIATPKFCPECGRRVQ